jgi:hypothetical protein
MQLYIMWYAFHTYRLAPRPTLAPARAGPETRSRRQNQTFQPYMCQIFYSQKLEMNNLNVKKKNQIVISARGPYGSSRNAFLS